MSKGSEWIKHHLETFVYSLCGAITLLATVILFVWSWNGSIKKSSQIIATDVVAEEGVRTEYLVGQPFSMDGLSLEVKKKKIPATECSVYADFSGAGKKQVTLTYAVDATTSYQGIFEVEVYFVRNIYVEQLPSKIEVSEQNTFSCDEDFEVRAEIVGHPKTDVFDVIEENGIFSTIVLHEDCYTTNALESNKTKGFYFANLYCGNLSIPFYFYNDAGETFLVEAEKDILHFDSEGKESLTLVVTDRSHSYQTDCVGKTQGVYIYTDGEGKQEKLEFAYELKEKEECFLSKKVKEAHDSVQEKYQMTYQNESFSIEEGLFQSAVVGGLIYEDHGYLMVIDSESRYLDFAPENEETKTSLHLYVTYYTFESSTGSGYAQGFYIFIDQDGNAHKMRFYLQTWTWDHVPLSITKVDNIENSVYVGDYLTIQYGGDLVVDVEQFVRGEGWTSQGKFVAAFDIWKVVVYNMA